MSSTRTIGRRRSRLGGAGRRRLRLGRVGRLGRLGRWVAAPKLRLTPRGRLAVVGVVVMAGLLFGAWMWLQDSSFVAVERVSISGASGADASAIRSALRSAARNMTTLDVQMGQLRTAVAPFPEVKRLRVRAVVPHRMVISVVEQRPVALIAIGTRHVPVADDGTLLRAVTASASLPTIPLSVPPVGRRLTEGWAADAVTLLAAAPGKLLGRISQVARLPGHGLVAQLRSGPSIYFGDATRSSAKWAAAIEVLSDPASAGASYIDVTDPSRPAAGAGLTSATAGTGLTSTAAGSTGAGAGSAPAPGPSASSPASTTAPTSSTGG